MSSKRPRILEVDDFEDVEDMTDDIPSYMRDDDLLCDKKHKVTDTQIVWDTAQTTSLKKPGFSVASLPYVAEAHKLGILTIAPDMTLNKNTYRTLSEQTETKTCIWDMIQNTPSFAAHKNASFHKRINTNCTATFSHALYPDVLWDMGALHHYFFQQFGSDTKNFTLHAAESSKVTFSLLMGRKKADYKAHIKCTIMENGTVRCKHAHHPAQLLVLLKRIERVFQNSGCPYFSYMKLTNIDITDMKLRFTIQDFDTVLFKDFSDWASEHTQKITTNLAWFPRESDTQETVLLLFCSDTALATISSSSQEHRKTLISEFKHKQNPEHVHGKIWHTGSVILTGRSLQIMQDAEACINKLYAHFVALQNQEQIKAQQKAAKEAASVTKNVRLSNCVIEDDIEREFNQMFDELYK